MQRPRRRGGITLGLLAALVVGLAGASSAPAMPESAQKGPSSPESAQKGPSSATLDTRPPTPPSDLVARAATLTTISLAWSPANDNVATAGYAVYSRGKRVGRPSSTGITVRGLACGKSYRLAVDAYDAAGNHSARRMIRASTRPCSPSTSAAQDTARPTVPKGLRVTEARQKLISIVWRPSRDKVEVAGYRLYRDAAHVATTARTSATFGIFTCGTTHQIGVEAFDAAGNVSARGLLTARTLPCKADTSPVVTKGRDPHPPSSPSGLATRGATLTTISLAWSPADDNVAVAGYAVYSRGKRVGRSSNASFTVRGLACGNSYRLAVDTFDAAGNRSARRMIRASTLPCSSSSPTSSPPEPSSPPGTSPQPTSPSPSPGDTTAPSRPANLRTTEATQTSITVAWDASNDDVGVSGYRLYRNGASVATTTGRTANFGGLACGLSYTLGVEALDAAGNQSQQAVITTRTDACPTGGGGDTIPPSVPVGLNLAGVTSSSISLSWVASFDNVGVVGYDIALNGVKVGVAAVPSHTIFGLNCGTTYSLAVVAFDAAGNRSPQAQLNVATSGCSAPPPPPPSGSAALWVDTNGGTCVRSPGAAYADAQACSWNQAYQAAQTGDLILVRGGNYGNVDIGPNKASIAAPGVTFRTASGENVVVGDLENGHIAGGGGGSNISLVGPVTARTFRSDVSNNITVDNWTIDCGGCDGIQTFHLEDSNNVTVRNSDISNNKNNSLMWINGTNLTFENNRIHDAGLPSGSGAHTECMYAWDVTNLTLKRNHFYHCSVMDVFITGNSVANGGFIENNVFEKPWENTGVISNSAYAFHFRNGGDPSPDPSNWDFRYNTFVGPLSITPNENPVGAGGMRVIGNVFLSGNPCGLSNTTYSYNAFVAGACGTNSITNSLASYLAGFTSPSDPGTYSLRPTSVLIDKGNPSDYPSVDKTGNARYTGSAPDIGAYE